MATKTATKVNLSPAQYAIASSASKQTGIPLTNSSSGSTVSGSGSVNLTPQQYSIASSSSRQTGVPLTSGGVAIPADKLATPAVQLPTMATPINQTNLLNSNNAALLGGLSPYGYGMENGQFVYEAPKEGDNFKSLLNDYLGAQPTPPSAEKIYNQLPEKRALERAQQEVQNYTGQINSIVAKRDADQLSLIGQGRGIPEVIIGGQQAQISREAAIQALPLQALLANAQGNKELAQQHLDTVFKLRMEDASNQYQYKKDVISAVYDFATKAEQRKLDALERLNTQNFTLMTNGVDFAQSLASSAISNGQAGVASKLAQIKTPNPSSPLFMEELANYNAEVARIAGQIVPKAVTGKYSTIQDKYIDQINTGVANSFSYKAVNSAKAYADGVIVSLAQKSGAGDIAAINQFQKVIDEGAVTRDQDVRLLQSSQSLVNKARTEIKKYGSGEQISETLRKQMATTVSSLYEAKVRALTDDPYVKAQIIKAAQNGIDTTDTILGQLGTFGNSPTPVSSGTSGSLPSGMTWTVIKN